MQQLGASWKKWETRPELRALAGAKLPALRGRRRSSEPDSQLPLHPVQRTAQPGQGSPAAPPQSQGPLVCARPEEEHRRRETAQQATAGRILELSPAGYTPPALNPNRGDSLPGLTVPVPKIPKGKKLKELRTEAVRVGFKHCYQQKDYQTILVVAEMLPESVLNEDEATPDDLRHGRDAHRCKRLILSHESAKSLLGVRCHRLGGVPRPDVRQ